MTSVSGVSSSTLSILSSATSWTASEIATLRSLAQKGMSANAIASQLDKSVAAVNQKINSLGLSSSSS